MLVENLVNEGLISSCAVASLAVQQTMSETSKINNAAGVEGLRIDVLV